MSRIFVLCFCLFSVSGCVLLSDFSKEFKKDIKEVVGKLPQSYLELNTPNTMSDYSPLDGMVFPSTILLKSETGYNIIADNKWWMNLEKIALSYSFEDIWGYELAPINTIPPSTVPQAKWNTIDKKYVARFELKIKPIFQHMSFKPHIIRAAYKYGYIVELKPQNRSAKAAFEIFKTTDTYAHSFRNHIRQESNYIAGELFIVDKVQYVQLGEYSITFNKDIPLRIGDKLAEILGLESTTQWKFDGRTFTRIASPRNDASGFILSWQYSRIHP